jgi:hypothetical protein
MADLQTWERLSPATERVMAAAGLAKDEAQTKICRAIADGTLKFRAKVGWHMIRPTRGKLLLEDKDFHTSTDLKPNDFDWEQSRPLTPWKVRHEIFRLPGLWNLEWIEVFSADISKLCSAWSSGEVVRRVWHEASATSTSPPALESDGTLAGEWTVGPRRGPRPKKFEQAKDAMRDDIQQGRLTLAGLKNMLEKDLEARYGVSRDTARKARSAVLSEFGGN